MPQEFIINDFSQGWTPADDPVNGRKNGLLRMDSLELDQNGALRLCGGSSLLFTYGSPAHTIFSKFLASAQYRYAALTDGSIYRDSTSIVTGGSITRAGFGAAFDYVIITSGNKRVKDTGSTVTDLGVTSAAAPVVTSAGAGVLTGSYEYVQINVVRNGSYIARSAVSPSDSIDVVDENVTVDPDNVAGAINEIWIFRRGNLLDQYYRVYRQTTSLGNSFTDLVTDQEALDEGITLDLNSLSVNSTDLPEAIIEVVGPVNTRMIYFTATTIHFSEVNSPDSYKPTQSIFITGSATGAEMFLFARKVSENIVLVGTTRDVYILTGTFITLPDGTLDVYFRHLGVENPPISIDADVYNANLVCMTAAGWKLTSINGAQINLCDPRVDRLYRGETLFTNKGIPIFLLPQLRYSCAVVRDKLFVRVPQIVDNNPALPFTYRMEVYDFKRQYWRPLTDYNPLILFGQEDDAVLGFFGTSNTLRSIDDQFTKLNNGVAQNLSLYTSIFDLGTPRNRKDLYTIKFRVYTAGDDVDLSITVDLDTSPIFIGTINSAFLDEVSIDLFTDIDTPIKVFQILIEGAPADFLLSNISIVYDLRPLQTSAVHMDLNLGPNKKRIRTFPFKIDNLNADVICTPSVDGIVGTPSTFSAATYVKTFLHQFSTDIFGVDYEIKLTSDSLFELYEAHPPEIVQTLPIAKRFDQVGPVELFRYGTLRRIEVRLIAFGGTSIPYTIYLDDTAIEAGTFTVVSGKESSFHKSVQPDQGIVLRVEFGPTLFDFHRYYARMQVAKSGRETENEWVIIDAAAQD